MLSSRLMYLKTKQLAHTTGVNAHLIIPVSLRRAGHLKLLFRLD